jgi:hypothetical protein
MFGARFKDSEHYKRSLNKLEIKVIPIVQMIGKIKPDGSLILAIGSVVSKVR